MPQRGGGAPDDGQSQAEPLARFRKVEAMKRLEDQLNLVGWDSRAVVEHLQLQPSRTPPATDQDASAAWAELDRVADQVAENGGQHRLVAHHAQRRGPHAQNDARGGRVLAPFRAQGVEEPSHGKGPKMRARDGRVLGRTGELPELTAESCEHGERQVEPRRRGRIDRPLDAVDHQDRRLERLSQVVPDRRHHAGARGALVLCILECREKNVLLTDRFRSIEFGARGGARVAGGNFENVASIHGVLDVELAPKGG